MSFGIRNVPNRTKVGILGLCGKGMGSGCWKSRSRVLSRFLYVFPKNGEPFIINIPDLEMFGVCVCFGKCHSRFIQFHMFFSNWKFAQQKLPTRKSVSKVRRYINSIVRNKAPFNISPTYHLFSGFNEHFFGGWFPRHWDLSSRGFEGDLPNAATFSAKPRVWLGWKRSYARRGFSMKLSRMGGQS